MCIRDSIQRFLGPPEERGDREAMERAEMGVRERVGGRTGVCLLYTSDAADERSSVDLGGRRIIKKKKKEQTERRYMSQITSARATER